MGRGGRDFVIFFSLLGVFIIEVLGRFFYGRFIGVVGFWLVDCFFGFGR